MIIIGIDPHKLVHTASALEPATNRRIDSVEVEATWGGYPRPLKWPPVSISDAGRWRARDRVVVGVPHGHQAEQDLPSCGLHREILRSKRPSVRPRTTRLARAAPCRPAYPNPQLSFKSQSCGQLSPDSRATRFASQLLALPVRLLVNRSNNRHLGTPTNVTYGYRRVVRRARDH
jgi:hypothetical protein